MEPPEVEEYGVELHVRSGRAVLVGRYGDSAREIDPDALTLPAELTTALAEWAQVVEVVLKAGQVEEGANAGELVSRRGRQLAGRLATVLDTDVDYADPVHGHVEVVSAAPSAAEWSLPSRPRPEPMEKTPWATGLTVSAFVAAVVMFAVVILSLGLGDTSRWLALAANLVVFLGLLPSILLARRTPVWRWVALGVVVGMVVAWIALLFTI